MDFSLSDEQQMLHDSARRLIASACDFDQRQRILASDAGWSRDLWRQMAELGLLAIDIPEADGGIGAGPVGVMLVSNAVGEGLLLEPFHASAIVATRAIVTLGSATQSECWLPLLASGELIAVLAHDEDAGSDTGGVATRATRCADGWRLRGTKSQVHHACAADLLLVTALTDDQELALFALPAGRAGLTLDAYTTVDGQRAADLSIDGVIAREDERIGADAGEAVQAVLDYALAALCADALGVLDRIHRVTIDYCRSRIQFGVPIGSFQALQHRMADMQMHLEQARSMSFLATTRCTDADPAARRAALSAAKVLIGQAARFIGQQAVQLHGGMGMTDELDVSHCFKRLLAFELRGGTTDEHLASCVRRLQQV